ncbi:MAG: hypothetical protein IT368_07730 [Candidatus Hydrogenedentes bacterium]|nr:hypothetical protein [Candidatus Hydrogenedentota bacterium]
MMPRVDESAIDELRDFVAGDLPQEQRAAVEESLRTDPALREALELVKLEQQSVRQWAHRRMPVGDFDELYARVSSRLGERPRASEATGGSGMWRWLDWLASPRWRPAVAGLFLLVIGQSVVIAWLAQDRPPEAAGEAYRSARPAGALPHEFVAITFRPEASEEQIRRFLLELEGQILAGPKPSGEYVVTAPGRAGKPLADHIRGNPIVLDARPIGVRPPSPLDR